MPTFGNNIKNPFSTHNPQDPTKKPLTKLQNMLGVSNEEPQQYALGGVVDPNAPKPVAFGAAQPAARQQRTGTGFTNLQKFMGASSGEKLGAAVGGSITEQADKARGGIGSEQAAFGSGLDAAKSVFNKADRDSAIADAGAGTTEAQAKKFQTYLGGDLGAKDLSGGLKGYGDLQSKASDVAQQGKDVESQAGRYNLLQRYASGGKQYTAGGKRLDSMLLGQGGGAELQKARLATGGVGEELARAQGGALGQYGEAKGMAKQFGADTEAALGTATKGLETEVDFKNKQAAKVKEHADILSGLGEAPTAEQEALTPGVQAAYQAQRTLAGERFGIANKDLYDLNETDIKNKYLGLDASKMASASQFATATQNAKMAALGRLGGQGNLNWGSGVGGEADSALRVDKAALGTTLAAQEAAANEAYKPGDADVENEKVAGANWRNARSLGNMGSTARYAGLGDLRAKIARGSDTDYDSSTGEIGTTLDRDQALAQYWQDSKDSDIAATQRTLDPLVKRQADLRTLKRGRKF